MAAFEGKPVGARKTKPKRAKKFSQLYVKLQCLSRGSPGTVYIVRNTDTDRKYVLKKVECHDESDAAKAFFEEMELKKVDHPYVTSYKDFFVTYEKDDSSMYINVIMEYFEKGNLETFIKGYQDREAAVPEKVIKKMIGEIMEGLVYIHQKGIIHRNIKPRNIFFKKDGALILGDLGVSTIMGDVTTNTRATAKSTMFMAPEINTQPHDQKTDLFSFSCVLLNLMTTFKYTDAAFVKVMKGIKEDFEELNEVLEIVSQHYSNNMVALIQALLRSTANARPNTLQLTRLGFMQECMLQTASSQLDKRSRQKNTSATKKYPLNQNLRSDPYKVLEYIADTIDHETYVAEGLTALSEILRDSEDAHEHVDQKARDLISLAMWDNILNKEVQIAGCFVLSNLVVFAKPEDMLFTPSVITIIHKIMTTHEHEAEVQLAAVDLILALSADERASRTIVDLGGIHDILEAMRHASYHATLQARACMALWSLTVDGENLKVAGKENAVRDVCVALNVHKVAPEVCEAGAAALVSLLLDDGCYDTFNELDCVGNLIAAIALHPKNPKVVKNCCKVLSTVIEANEECAYRFLTSDNPDDENPTGLPTVMEAYRLHKDNSNVVEAIVRLLLELTRYDDINVEMQAALIGPLLLSEVHKQYKENRDIMGPVEEALDRLGASVTRTNRSSWAPSLALPLRPFRFRGEVRQSCAAMLRKWVDYKPEPTATTDNKSEESSLKSSEKAPRPRAKSEDQSHRGPRKGTLAVGTKNKRGN